MGHFKLRLVKVAVIFLFCGLQQGFAQNNATFSKLTAIPESLQGKHRIQQDSTGNLWVVSRDRVTRYNSVEIFNYTKFKGLPEETSGKIGDLYIDSSNRVWLGTQGGLTLYDPAKDQFNLFSKIQKGNSGTITQITEDSDGTLWLSSFNGIWKLTAEGMEAEKPVISRISSDKLSINTFIVVKNKLLIGAAEGLFLLDKYRSRAQKVSMGWKDYNITGLLYTGDRYLIGTSENGLFQADAALTHFDKVYGLPVASMKYPINEIFETNNGNFYVATDGGGMLYLDQSLKVIEEYKHIPGNASSLGSDQIADIYVKDNNIMWLSTDVGGIYYLNLNRNNFNTLHHDPTRSSSLSDNFTTAIEKDKNGNIWFGTKDGVSIWYPANNYWQHLRNLSYKYNPNTPDQISDLKSDGIHMWIATLNDGVYKININTFLRAQYSTTAHFQTGIDHATALCVDTNHNVWIGGEDGKMSVVLADGRIKTISLNQVKTIIESYDGNILAAGNNGVYSVNPDNLRFREIKKLAPDPERLPYFSINSMVENSDKKLILGTDGAGIVIYDQKTEKVRIIDEKDGMPSSVIQGIIPDGINEIWASTRQGLANINLRGGKVVIKVFDDKDGLASSNFNANSFAKLSSEQYMFGGVNGVTMFDPVELKNQSAAVPHLVLQDLNIQNNENQKSIKIEDPKSVKKLNLKTSQNSFAFKFLGISLPDASKVTYSWKLEGYDKEWSKPTTQREVQYANLDAGNYVFKLKAANSDGLWSPVKEIPITIASAWWSTKQAYVMYAVIALFLFIIAYFINKAVVKNKRTKAREDYYNKLAYEIRTPLNILLTSLNNIAEEGEQERNYRIKSTVNKLNALFDPILNYDELKSQKFMAPKISRVKLHEHIEELLLDFGPILIQKNIEVKLNDEYDKENFYYDIDHLNTIFFNLISNSMNYLSTDGKIIINLMETNKGDLKIQVADNGRGIPKKHQKIIATYYRSNKEIGSRLPGEVLSLLMVKDLLNKSGGSIVFESVKNEGTTFSLILQNRYKDYGAKEKMITVEAPKNGETIIIKKINTSTLNPDHELPGELKDDVVYDGRPEKILIVENNLELRKILVQSIGKYFKILEAENIAEALLIATSDKPDVILSDMDLSPMNGINLIEAFKGKNLREIPLFMMTSNRRDLHQQANSNSRIKGFIEKPINVNNFLERLIAILDHPEPEFGAEEKTSGLKEVPQENMEDSAFIAQLKNVIYRNLENTNFTATNLGEVVNMNYNALYLKLKTSLNISPADFITRTRLDFGKSLLEQGNFSMGEVAEKAGFDSEEDFKSSYKRNFGQHPVVQKEKNYRT